jgi:hypothetical protein
MEVSDQLHAPAALLPGKEPLVPIGQEDGWAPEQLRTRWWREKFQAQQGIEPQNPDSPTLSLVAIPTELSRLLHRDVEVKLNVFLTSALYTEVSDSRFSYFNRRGRASDIHWGGVGLKVLIKKATFPYHEQNPYCPARSPSF